MVLKKDHLAVFVLPNFNSLQDPKFTWRKMDKFQIDFLQVHVQIVYYRRVLERAQVLT